MKKCRADKKVRKQVLKAKEQVCVDYKLLVITNAKHSTLVAGCICYSKTSQGTCFAFFLLRQ